VYQPVQKCSNCGAGLTLDDMRGTQCPYCQVVYPHHAQAAQHAQVAGLMMNQMLAQQAQIQNPWRQAYGAPPLGGGPPGGPPPNVGAVPPGQVFPYGDPGQLVQAQFQQAQRMGRRIMLTVVISIAAVFVLVILGVGLAIALSFP
jgi:hypothetical protein